MRFWCFIYSSTFILMTDVLGFSATIELHNRPKRARTKPIACLDKFAAISGHTMCLAQQRSITVTPEDRDAIVQQHNVIRGSVNPTATDMRIMKYDETLEDEAQLWAEHCQMAHDDAHKRALPGQFTVGQNILTNNVKLNWMDVIQNWEREINKFHYNISANIFEEVGHYTQIIWAQTAFIGCGVSKCTDTYFYVCNYGPSGNVGGFSKPYNSGTECGACSGHCNTTTKLCDCGNNSICWNDGEHNQATCTCSCNKNVQFYEPEKCQLNCMQGRDSPSCGMPPFEKESCSTNIAAVVYCPWLCNICPYAGKDYKEGSNTLPSINNYAVAVMQSTVLVLLLIGHYLTY